VWRDNDDVRIDLQLLDLCGSPLLQSLAMNMPLHELIPRLQRSVRFWRATSLILAAALLSVLATGVTFFGLAHQRSIAMEEAMRNEAVARQQEAAAEAARALLERQLGEAKEQNND
jgi:hypothetical protein